MSGLLWCAYLEDEEETTGGELKVYRASIRLLYQVYRPSKKGSYNGNYPPENLLEGGGGEHSRALKKDPKCRSLSIIPWGLGFRVQGSLSILP